VLKNLLVQGDNLKFLKTLPDESVQLIYIDPPFNTGKIQTRPIQKMTVDSRGETIGYGGRRYKSEKIGQYSYRDSFDDFNSFLQPRMQEAKRILKKSGSIYLHLDYRESHYAKVEMDKLFGRDNFLNEIIWAYDYGAKAKNRWPAKHDTILVYVKDTNNYYFNNEEVDREPYMAPGLVTKEKAERGKLPTDVWWHTIVSPTGKEKTGYPTQKPEGILRRIVQASSKEGDTVLDFFAGSGTTGAVASKLGRNFILVDQNPQSIEVIKKRLKDTDFEFKDDSK
jgi:site-specific DNA-methyltransferase (adenine-specific)